MDPAPQSGRLKQKRIQRFEIRFGDVSITLFALMVALTAITELIVFLFPPYSTHIPQGYTVGLGFRFLFSPPDLGQIEVAAWGMEFLGILVIGALCFFVARLVESARLSTHERDS